MELVPTRGVRVANAGLGGVPAVASVVYGIQATAVLPRLSACLALLLSVTIAVRGYRAGVSCGNGELTVRGYLWTRTIPRSGIVEITDFPAVRWTDPRGRGRWSPLWVFRADSREIARSAASKNQDLAALRRWVRGRAKSS
ncbi:hypothetical protein [Streptomyces xylophagus]|uniref:hypothetical protein n=1 Tax=Streptomyces xylophagus TaxID=285514 RepID=UPI0005B96360|nr:hypothetical protein [Streptomyces xylophagus]